jgi:hypothetical protein
MGNALRFLCCKPTAAGDSESLGHHGVSAATVGVSALAQDLFHFEINSQVCWSFFGFESVEQVVRNQDE